MNSIMKRSFAALALLLTSALLSSSLQAAQVDDDSQYGGSKDETRYPIGCRDVGYKEHLKTIALFPGKEGALQSMFFFYNKLPEAVSLYQMRDKNSEYSTRYNHTIRGNSWAVLATGEPLVKFICARGDGKDSYGTIIDCAESIKICEYVNVKFGLNNKGNFWIVESNTRNGAVSEVVHYGIIPGV